MEEIRKWCSQSENYAAGDATRVGSLEFQGCLSMMKSILAVQLFSSNSINLRIY